MRLNIDKQIDLYINEETYHDSNKFEISILTHCNSIKEGSDKVKYIRKYFKDITVIICPKDISKTNKVYLIIDNFHKIKDDFISVLDYIVSNIDNNEISIVIGLDRKFAFENSVILETIDKWKLDNKVIDLKLDKLNEEDIGKLTKSILGISYIPKKFSSILYKGSQGNPLYLEYIIKLGYIRRVKL